VTEQNRPPVWQMVREAVEALGGTTMNVAVRDWVLSEYPGTNKNTVQCAICACSVNHPSRVHHAINGSPRRTFGQYDFLFRSGRGQLELYDPARHGQWEIYEREDGRLGVRQTDAEALPEMTAEANAAEASGGGPFAAEAHLRDYLAQHLELIEPGLELYVDEDGVNGVEYPTAVGRIDILAVDKEEGFVAVELKVSRGPDAVAGQVLRYKNWVKRHLAEGRPVRGIIVAQHVSERVLYAIAGDPEVSAMEYELSLHLRPVADEI